MNFFTCLLWNSNPTPKSSFPALIDPTVKSFTPLSFTALIKVYGAPTRENPPTKIVSPSLTSAIASSAE